jgi:hypothetical protein
MRAIAFVFKRALVVSAARAFALSIERDYCISNKYTCQAQFAIDGYIFWLYNKGMKKPKRGRPPKEAGRLRDKPMLVKLEATEKEAFRDAADLAGVPLSTWVRERLRQIATRELEKAARPIAFLRH